MQLSYAGEENIKEEEMQQVDPDMSEGESALTDSDSENGEVYGENEAEPDEALEETDDVQEDGAGNSNEEMDAGYAADDYDPEPMTEGEEEQSKEEESPELSENGEEESEQPEEEGEAVSPDYRRFLPGLGVARAMLLPHYQMVRDSRVDGLLLFEEITLPDSAGRVFYAVPDGSFLLGRNGHETLYGEAYRIRDGRMALVCRENEALALS